jgi:hypothetical protein
MPIQWIKASSPPLSAVGAIAADDKQLPFALSAMERLGWVAENAAGGVEQCIDQGRLTVVGMGAVQAALHDIRLQPSGPAVTRARSLLRYVAREPLAAMEAVRLDGMMLEFVEQERSLALCSFRRYSLCRSCSGRRSSVQQR